MLIIRNEQMRAFEVPLFEGWVEAHVRQYFPSKCASMQSGELQKRIREGIAKGRRYGFSGDADVCRFVDISIVLGAGFDDDPRLPWARDILNDPAFKDASVRLEMLFEAASAHLRKPHDMAAELATAEKTEEEVEKASAEEPEEDEEPEPEEDEPEDEDE
ncbi:MAG: hypothetical protein LAQ69_45995 [Acidobacteriia bacterium]|nr:hypothetical protein [Terriglobia bacterium]